MIFASGENKDAVMWPINRIRIGGLLLILRWPGVAKRRQATLVAPAHPVLCDLCTSIYKTGPELQEKYLDEPGRILFSYRDRI